MCQNDNSMSIKNLIKEHKSDESNLHVSNIKLNCNKRKNNDLQSEFQWIKRVNLHDYLLLPDSEFTLDDMRWLSCSHYGKITELNKFYDQFNTVGEMINKIFDNPTRTIRKTMFSDISTGTSTKYVQDWVLKNFPKFNEMKKAEFLLNKFMEESDLELINVSAKTYFYKNENNDYPRYCIPYDLIRERNSLIYDHHLFGYFSTTIPGQNYIYIISSILDPPPAKYEYEFRLCDIYKIMKEQIQTHQTLSQISTKSEKIIEYISKFVIYKICA